MTVVLIVLFLLMAYNSKIYLKGSNEEYLSKSNTAAVKGCFLIFVFMSHFSQYITSWNQWDFIFLRFGRGLSQLMVAMFLFYSGFGVSESVKRKGREYVKKMPRHRFLSVLLQFDIAVIVFLIAGLLLGSKFSLKTVLLSFTGLTSLGNSNWYIFAVLILYIISFVSYFVFKDKPIAGAAAITVLSVGAVLLLRQFKEPYWYNTIICYAIGVWYSTLKKPIESLLSKKWVCEICFVLSVAAFAVTKRYSSRFLVYELMVAAFTIMIVLFTKKVSIGNRVLRYLGNHLFSLYIMQRLPMILLKNTPVIGNKMVFFFVCAAATLLIGAVFDKLTGKLLKVLKL